MIKSFFILIKRKIYNPNKVIRDLEYLKREIQITIDGSDHEILHNVFNNISKRLAICEENIKSI